MKSKMNYLTLETLGMIIASVLIIAGVVIYNSVSYVPAGLPYDTTTEVLESKIHRIKYGAVSVSDSGVHCVIDVVVVYTSVSDEMKESELLVKLDRKVLDLITENGGMCNLKSMRHLGDLIIQEVDFLNIESVPIVRPRQVYMSTSEWDIQPTYPSPSHVKMLDSMITLSMINKYLSEYGNDQ